LAEITSKPGFLTNIVARFSGAALRDGQLQLPFRIGGTIDNPVCFKGTGDKGVNAVPNLRETKTTPGHQTPERKLRRPSWRADWMEK